MRKLLCRPDGWKRCFAASINRRLIAPIGVFLICVPLPLSAQTELDNPQTRQDIRNCIQLGNADEQIYSCTKLINTFGNKYPTPLSAWLHHRAILFMDKGEYAKAMSDVNEAIRLRPDVYLWYVSRGRLYDALKDFDHAIADFNESIRLNPRSPEGYYYRGLAREHHGEDAISDYRESAARDPSWQPPLDKLRAKFAEATRLNQTAMLLVSQGKYGEAEPIMKEALAITEATLGPNLQVTNALSNLGEVYRRQKNYSEARLYMEKALSMAEKTSGASNRRTAGTLIDIALLDIEEDRFEEAKPLEERLFKILRSSEGTKSLLFGTLAQFSGKYVDKNRCETAAPLLKEAAQIKREFSDEIDKGPKGPVQTFEVLTEKCGAKLRQDQGGRP